MPHGDITQRIEYSEKYFDETRKYGFIGTREHGDVFVNIVEKEKAAHLKVWQTSSTSTKSMFDEICLANPLEFDLEPVEGKPLPRAVNLRAAPVHATGNSRETPGSRVGVHGHGVGSLPLSDGLGSHAIVLRGLATA